MDTTPFPNQAEDAVTEPSYERDVVAWANEQARRLRAGEFHRLDIEHIADEIEDVGRSEKRELASRISVLMAHLLKWQYQPERRGASWTGTIRVQRRQIRRKLDEVPSLKTLLRDPEWQQSVWDDALASAYRETGLEDLPDSCPWDWQSEVLQDDWLPT